MSRRCAYVCSLRGFCYSVVRYLRVNMDYCLLILIYLIVVLIVFVVLVIVFALYSLCIVRLLLLV
jgi:hypothetical protein